MSWDARDRREPHEAELFSGKILISGVGFLVLTAMWALLSFFQYYDEHPELGTANVVTAMLHFVTGLAILFRRPLAFYAGLALAVAAIGLAVANGYYFPIVPEGSLAALLFFSREDLFRTQEQAGPSRN